jgi:hypothetical protein
MLLQDPFSTGNSRTIHGSVAKARRDPFAAAAFDRAKPHPMRVCAIADPRGPEKCARHRIAIPPMHKITFDLRGFTAFTETLGRPWEPTIKCGRAVFFL